MRDPRRRYERWLRVYPRTYRSVRGEEILATLLDASSEQVRPAFGDLLRIVAHAMRVRVRLCAGRPVRRSLPQPVRLVTWLLVGVAVFDWYNALVTHSGPRDPGSPLRGIAAGFLFFVLNVLLQTRRRLLYVLVIGVFLTLLAMVLVATGPTGIGVVFDVPYILFVVLLIVGWHPYMVAIRDCASPSKEVGRVERR